MRERVMVPTASGPMPGYRVIPFNEPEKTLEETLAIYRYRVEGRYPGHRRHGGRRAPRHWLTHTANLTLEQAQHVYGWFHYSCMEPLHDGPDDARIVEQSTGEVIEVPATLYPVPEKLPNTQRLTVPISPEGWEAVQRGQRYSDSWPRVRENKHGVKVHYWTGHNGRPHYHYAYEFPDGSIRVTPSEWKAGYCKDREEEWDLREQRLRKVGLRP